MALIAFKLLTHSSTEYPTTSKMCTTFIVAGCLEDLVAATSQEGDGRRGRGASLELDQKQVELHKICP